MSEEKNTEILLLYLGVRVGAKEKRVFSYYVYNYIEHKNGIPNLNSLDSERILSFGGRKPPGRASPGAIISCEDRGEGAYGAFKYHSRWPHDEQVTAIQALARADQLELESRKSKRAAEQRDFVKATLDPIRDAYLAASFKAKKYLLAAVIEYITRGR